ncbi:MAG TPA: hypothetical protein PK566_14230 [Pseudobacteroides sp.]|nr:hypothetical protein [Pseudobacteroides sp.]
MKNYYEIIDDTCYIWVMGKGQQMYALISAEDLPKADSVPGTWTARYSERGDTWYVMTNVDGKQIRLHRLIMGVTDPKIEVDHKNWNGLNNCRWNLRIATHSENNQNMKGTRKQNKSNLPGVGEYKGKYRARITVDGKTKYLGYFETPEEAHQEYLKAKAEYHPFSYQARTKQD